MGQKRNNLLDNGHVGFSLEYSDYKVSELVAIVTEARRLVQLALCLQVFGLFELLILSSDSRLHNKL